MLYLAYGLTVVNYIFYCLSRYMKQKKYMLLLDIGAKVTTTISLLLLGSKTGMFNMLFAMALLIFNYCYETKECITKKYNIIVFGIAILVYCSILTFTYEGITSILVFTTSIISLTSNQFFTPQKMRVTGVFNSIIYLMYQISLKNWVGLLEVLVIISNATSWFKYRAIDKD